MSATLWEQLLAGYVCVRQIKDVWSLLHGRDCDQSQATGTRNHTATKFFGTFRMIQGLKPATYTTGRSVFQALFQYLNY